MPTGIVAALVEVKFSANKNSFQEKTKVRMATAARPVLVLSYT